MTQYLSVGSVAFTCVSQIFLVGLCADDLLAVKVEAAERIAISALLLQYVEKLIEVSWFTTSIFFGSLSPFMLFKKDAITCFPPSETLLYLNTYIVFSCLASLLLGSKFVRRRLRLRKDWSKYRRFVTICGSLLLQVGATVFTGYILISAGETDYEVSEINLSAAILLWFARPLATFCVTWLSIVDRREYSDNSREVGIVDTIYGLVNVYIYGYWAHATNGRPGESATLPRRLLRAGSALGLLSFILNLYCVIATDHIEKSWQPEAQEKPEKAAMTGPSLGVTLFLHGLRFLANWLLWAGFLLNDGSSFCIVGSSMWRVTVIWLFIPFADGLWRGWTSVYKEKKEETGVPLMSGWERSEELGV